MNDQIWPPGGVTWATSMAQTPLLDDRCVTYTNNFYDLKIQKKM